MLIKHARIYKRSFQTAFIDISKLIIAGLLITATVLILFSMGVFSKLNLSNAPEPIKTITKAIPGQEFDTSESRAKGTIRQGCLGGRDCIPSIDEPQFISAEEAESRGEIQDSDVVFAIEHKGVARAYSQRILNWHEIVNETIEGDPILVTFCPLCGTAIGFIRQIEVDGVSQTVEFGVSGKLVNSNLVMYDRETETLWQQLGGEAIVGELVGQQLEPFRIDTVLWKDWKALHPDTQVLSQDTGFSRDYTRSPYGDYEVNNETFLFRPEVEDDRLPSKDMVWGVVINGQAKAYHDKALAAVGTLEDEVAGEKLTITRNDAGQVRFTKEDGSDVVPDRSMWFAWFAFNPETELYK